MNIHAVWLIKLIVLQKCFHFKDNFFHLFIYSFVHLFFLWVPPSTLSVRVSLSLSRPAPPHLTLDLFEHISAGVGEGLVGKVAGNVQKK